VAAAKVVDAYAKTNDKFVILGGAMGNAALDPAGVKAVAQLPSREELIASIVACIGRLPPTWPGRSARLPRTSRAFSLPSRSVPPESDVMPRGPWGPCVGTQLNGKQTNG
jgi:hypothetical protein